LLPHVRFCILAGKEYVEPLERWTCCAGRIDQPLAGMQIGQRLHYLKQAVANSVQLY
jgi:hypothetical protein